MNLSSYISSVQTLLGDSSAIRWTSAEISECIRNALGEYSRAWPQIKTGTLTVTTASRDQCLASLSGITAVLEVIYPYVSTNVDHRCIDDWYIYWLQGVAYIHIGQSSSCPAVGEKIYLTYALAHTIADLDGAASTTVRADHERMIVIGAAAYALEQRANAITESWGRRSRQDQSIESAGIYRQRFDEWLSQLRTEFSPPRPHTGWPDRGWELDQWDKESDIHG